MSFYQPLQNSNSWLVYARSVAHLLLCVEMSNGHFLGAMGWDVFFPREPLASMDFRCFCHPLTITINYFFYLLTIGLDGFSTVLGSFNHCHLMIFNPQTIAFNGFQILDTNCQRWF